MNEEQRFVIDVFGKGFRTYKNENFVLYGVGKNTEAILDADLGYSILGLMDEKTVGQYRYGKKVLSEAEVIAVKPIIAIIARDSVVSIIYERIRHLEKYGIRIFDFSGKLMCGRKSCQHLQLDYWNRSVGELYELIDQHSCISFDIFDTLLMRKVLEPDDVFLLMENMYSVKTEVPFHIMRQEAANVLGSTASLREIYQYIESRFCIRNIDVVRWEQQEFLLDKELIIPRTVMRNIYSYAQSKNKQIWLISDMYYSVAQIEELLLDNGITGYDQLFISCDIRKSKENGDLYRYCKKISHRDNWLHIGDNRRADIEEAQKNNIDSFHIYSSYELLMASSLRKLAVHLGTLQRRLMLGLFVAEAFNDPFCMYHTDGVFCADDLREIGYLFVGPVLEEFVRWMFNVAVEQQCEQILFPSRDGYLIQKIYRILGDGLPGYVADNCYFRASRRAVTVAAIEGKEDIDFISKRLFRGSNVEFLQQRFGLDVYDDVSCVENINNMSIEDCIDQNIIAILNEAQNEKREYVKYLDEQGIINAKRQLVFDFVAGGTVQYFLSKILEKKLIGCYFATMNLPNDMFRKMEDIRAAFGNVTSYDVQSNIGRYYLFLEAILTDGNATFVKINTDGNFIYEEQTDDDKRRWKDIKKVHKGVCQYVQDIKKYGIDRPVELNFADELYGNLFSENVNIVDKIKQIFYNDDLYDGTGKYSFWACSGAED